MFGGWSIDYWGGHQDFCHKSRGLEIFFPVGLGGGGRKKICTSHENITGPLPPPPPAGNKWLVPYSRPLQ